MTQANQLQVDMGKDIETFQLPEGASAAELNGAATQVNVSSIVSVVSTVFTFRENSNTPGRTLEQTRTVTRPPGSGFFVGLNAINGAFTTSDFQHLTERPLGQFLASLGLRGNNTLVCQVRLTDSNSDDPIFISVGAFIVFFT
jgi:hypothetical protein